MFATLEARDPTLAATVHDIRNHAAEDTRFGMRYTGTLTTQRTARRFWTCPESENWSLMSAAVRKKVGRSGKKNRE